MTSIPMWRLRREAGRRPTSTSSMIPTDETLFQASRLFGRRPAASRRPTPSERCAFLFSDLGSSFAVPSQTPDAAQSAARANLKASGARAGRGDSRSAKLATEDGVAAGDHEARPRLER